MKKLTTFFLFILSTFVCYGGVDDGKRRKKPEVDIKQTLIIVYSSDCAYCDQLNDVLATNGELYESLTSKYTVQKVEIHSEEGRVVSGKFNIRTVPSYVIISPDASGYEVRKGFSTARKFATMLAIEYVPEISIDTDAPQTDSKNSGLIAGCGDGVVDAGETCDDGNMNSGDGCSATCSTETGFYCTGSPSTCNSVCGDGIPAGIEGCDDGNVSNADGCSASCQVEPGYVCTGSPSTCSVAGDDCSNAVPLIGTSGTINGNNNAAGNSATPTCIAPNNHDIFYSFSLPAARTVRFFTTSGLDLVMALLNGNCGALSIIVCDDEAGQASNPSLQIFLPAGTYYIRVYSYNSSNYGSYSLVYNLNDISLCGNGNSDPGEECDDGNLVNGDGCNSTCQYESLTKGVAINEDQTRSHPSAMVDIKSSNKGLLIPRMTTAQRTAITSPAKGLFVFDMTTASFWYYNGTIWKELATL